MANNEILFYILIPVYNVEKYIDACIQSILAQTYQNFQVVMVDDGSTDQSGNICDQYAEQDQRIHVIHQENHGQLYTRQKANEFVKQNGNITNTNAYIVYLDSDDSLKPYALETIRQTVALQQCDMVIYRYDLVRNGKKVIQFQKEKIYTGTITDKRDLYKLVFLNAGYNSLCRKAISADLLATPENQTAYHIKHAEDLLQSIPYYKHCKKAVFIRDALYNYTVNPTSVTHTVRYETKKIDTTVRQTVWEFLKAEDVWTPDDYEKYLVYLRQLLRNELETISRFDTTLQNKARLFDEIRADTYYQMVINSRKPNDNLLNLLVQGNDALLCQTASKKKLIRKAIEKIKNR